MHQGRRGAGAELRIEHARQRLVLDFDQLQRLFRDFGRVGGHGGHRLADEADTIQGEDATILQIKAGVAGEVLARDYHPHPRYSPRLAYINAFDEAVWNGAALERTIQQVGAELQVVHIACRARHLRPAFDPLGAGADEGGFGVLRTAYCVLWIRRFADSPIHAATSFAARAAIFTASIMRI